MIRAIKSVLITVLLAACSAPPWPVDEPPLAPILPTRLPTSVVTAATIASSLPPSTSPSAETSPPSAPGCPYPPSYEEEGPLPLPGPEELRWAAVPTPSGTLMNLEGLTTPILQLDASPSGRWWLMSMLLEQIGGGSFYQAHFVIDAVGNGHWVATHKSDGGYTQTEWLPDGRLLWIDDGQLNIARADGQDRRVLASPAEVREFWVGADDTVLVSGEDGLLRLFLADGQWEQVPDSKQVSYPGANLQLSDDGTFAAAINDGEIRYIPLQPGTQARLLATIQYPGRGGRINPPVPVPNTPYLYLQEVERPNGDTTSMLIDIRDGHMEPFAEFVPGGLWAPQASPDGRWLYVWTLRSNAYQLYVAPSPDLRTGTVIYTTSDPRDEIVWEPEHDIIGIIPRATPQRLLRFTLPTGDPIPPSGQPGDSLPALRFVLDPSEVPSYPNPIPDFRVLALAPQAEIVWALDLPPATASGIRIYPAGESRVFVEMVTFQGGISTPCQYEQILWLWHAPTTN